MDYILTLNKITKADVEEVGYKAVDLAKLFEKKMNVPFSFVIKKHALENFIEKHQLQTAIDEVLSKINYEQEESLVEAFKKIREIFNKIEFCEEFQISLMEAYETLTIDIDNFNISKLVSGIEKPFITLISSQTYVSDSENNEGVIDSAKGKKQFFQGIKNIWVSLFTPNELLYRKKNNITTIGTAIIVQKMIDPEISAIAYSGEEEIILKTYFGYQDFEDEIEKDVVVVSKEDLIVKNSKPNPQRQIILRDLRDNLLTKKPLRDEGIKLNDKELSEVARLAKRAEDHIGKPLKVFISIRKSKNYILFCNRVIRIEKKEEEIVEGPEEPAILETYDSETTEEIKQEKQDEEEKEEEIREVPLEEDLAFLDQIESIEQQNIEDKQQEFEEQETISEAVELEPIIDIEEEVKPLEEIKPEEELPIPIPPEIKNEIETKTEEEKPVEISEPEKELDISQLKEEIESIIPEPEKEEESITFEEEKEELPPPKPPEKDLFEEDEQDDFIITTNVENNKVENSSAEASDESKKEQEIVKENFEKIIGALKKRYNEILNKDSEDMHEMILVLKTMIEIPLEKEILRINELSKEDSVSLDDAEFSKETADKFLEEFK